MPAAFSSSSEIKINLGQWRDAERGVRKNKRNLMIKERRSLDIRHLKQDDAFNKTWCSVLSINKFVTWQHLSIERTGGHVVLKASSCLRSLLPNQRARSLDMKYYLVTGGLSSVTKP